MYIKQVVIEGFKSYREQIATKPFSLKVNCVGAPKRKVNSGRSVQLYERAGDSLPSPTGELVVDCDSIARMPNVSFTIENKSFILTPEQYILKVREDNFTSCFSGFIAIDVPPPQGPLWSFDSDRLDSLRWKNGIYLGKSPNLVVLKIIGEGS